MRWIRHFFRDLTAVLFVCFFFIMSWEKAILEINLYTGIYFPQSFSLLLFSFRVLTECRMCVYLDYPYCFRLSLLESGVKRLTRSLNCKGEDDNLVPWNPWLTSCAVGLHCDVWHGSHAPRHELYQTKMWTIIISLGFVLSFEVREHWDLCNSYC